MDWTGATLASTLLAMSALGLGACGADTGSRPGDAGTSDGGPTADSASGAVPPPDCTMSFGGGRDGDPMGGTLRIGTRDPASGFTAWADGLTVPFYWGFQGGTMITPVLRVEGSTLSGDPVCVHVEIMNTTTDDGPPLALTLYARDVELHGVDGVYETESLFDQLDEVSPQGRALSLGATVALSTWSRSATVRVLIGAEGIHR